MLSRQDLEAICLRLGDPFEGSRNALEKLKVHALKTETDAVFYARGILDIYETVIGRVDKDFDDARQRAEALKDQYLRRMKPTNFFGFPHGYDPDFSLDHVEWKLSEAESKAQFKKNEVVKTLQRELADESVDVRTERHMVILNTDSGRYGFYLENPNRIMRDAYPIWTPFGPYYWLGGSKYSIPKRRYHIPRIIGTSR